MPNTPYGTAHHAGPHPLTAAMLSVIPGLGQLYAGDRRKAFLFLDVSAVNAILLCIVFCTQPLIRMLQEVARTFHCRPNDVVLKALEGAHLGTPASLLFLALTAMFAGYAARDAFDQANLQQRRPLYPQPVIELSEATSGSYLFHFCMMFSCFILAIFFVLPPPQNKQIVSVTMVDLRSPTQEKVETKRQIATENQKAHGHRDLAKPHSASAAMSQKQNESRAINHIHLQPQPATEAQRARSIAAPIPQLRAIPVFRAQAQPSRQEVPQPRLIALNNGLATPSLSPLSMSRSALPTPGLPSVSSINHAVGLPTAAPSAVTVSRSSNRGIPVPSINAGTASSPAVSGGAPAPVNVSSNFSGKGATDVPTAAAGRSHFDPSSMSAPGPVLASAPRSGSSNIKILPNTSTGGSGARRGATSGSGFNNPLRDADGSPSADEGFKIDYSAYMANLQRRIKKNWFPPRDSISKRVSVTFTIGRDGELSNLKIRHSSGTQHADDAAIKAVQASAPFPPLPAGSPESVDIEFTFDYNVFSGGRQF